MTNPSTDDLPTEARPPVPIVAALALYLASVQILIAGSLAMDVPYESPGYARAFIPVEAALALTLLAGTFLFFRPAIIGLRLPGVVNWKHLAPIGLMLITGFGVWIARWAALPQGVERDMRLTLGTLAASVLIGFTEEWMYRGLLLVLLVHWLGLRRGGLLSLALFGALHLSNVLVGLPLWVALIQVPSAALSGAIFLLVALETRSILLPIVGHALWDFFLIDGAQATALGSETLAIGLILPIPWLMGLTSLYLLRRFDRTVPFGD